MALVGSAFGFGEKIPPDAVEEFTCAWVREKFGSLEARLDVENNKAREYALAFRRAELERLAKELKSLNDLARALVLLWPTEELHEYQKKLVRLKKRCIRSC